MASVMLFVLRRAAVLGFALTLACTGRIGAERTEPPMPRGGSGGATPQAGGSGGAFPTDDLFACASGDSPQPSPARVWRLSSLQLRNAAAVVFAGRPTGPRAAIAEPAVTWTPPFQTTSSTDRFSNQAASYAMDDFELARVLDASDALAHALVASIEQLPSSCLSTGAPFAACVTSLLRERGELAFRRPLTDAELMQLTGVVVAQREALGDADALALGFQAMLASPAFLFRAELGDEPTDRAGVRRLGDWELAAALALTLTDRPADVALAEAARAGQLRSREQLRGHVLRLLGDPATQPTVQRWLREYLRYDRAPLVFKDPKLYPDHDAAALVRAADGFVASSLGGGALLPALFAASGGALAQPAFLVAWSHPDATDPVRRGRFVSDSLLCRDVPNLPIAQVPPLPDLGPNAPLRARLAQHSSDPGCAACHHLMDPIGLGFEGYDHLGRRREREAGQPVDERGVLTDAGESVDGAFVGVGDLAQRLARSPVVSRCFTWHAFAYWMGRRPTQADGCALAEAHEAFTRSGGDVRELVAALLTSPAFVERTGAEAAK